MVNILKLADYKYPPVTQDDVYKEIFEQAENFKKNIKKLFVERSHYSG